MLHRFSAGRFLALLPTLLLLACASQGPVVPDTRPAAETGEPAAPSATTALAPAPRVARRRLWAVYGSIQAFKWTEEHGGDELLKETGPMYSLGIEFHNRAVRTRSEIFGGNIDYDGQTQSGVPVTTDSHYGGLLAECDYFVLSSFRRREPVIGHADWQPFVGGGFRYWLRDLQDTKQAGGYREDWFTFYGHVGTDVVVPLRADSRWYGSVRLGYSLYNLETANLDRFGYSNVTLHPGLGPRFRIETGLDWRALKTAIFLEFVRFTESDVEDGVFQPESDMTIIGLNVGFRW